MESNVEELLEQIKDGKMSRRRFIKLATALGLSLGTVDTLLTGCASEATPTPTARPAPTPTLEVDPWAAIPTAPKPDKINVVVWEYGGIYEGLPERFEEDWGVKVDILLQPMVEEQVAKVTSMYAAGEQIDCISVMPQYLGRYVEEGMLMPIDDMPGAREYIADFTTLMEQSTTVQGKHYGLPYFTGCWINMYYRDLMEKAGIDEPFKTWDECVEQSLKAKKDGVCEYPILWVGGVGPEQLPGTWYNLTWNQGGTWFDKDLAPQFGPGSIARETLEWWRKTFLEWEIADPTSLEVRFIPAAKAFATGDYIYHPLNQTYYFTIVNDPEVSPIAGKADAFLLPGDHKVIGFASPYCMMMSAAEPEWAWKMLQYLGGRIKGGEFLQPMLLTKEFMLGSGFESIMNSMEIADTWSKWATVDVIVKQFESASDTTECIPVLHEAWYPKWLVGVEHSVNNQVQACLRGEITADECCDNIVDKGIEEAKVTV